MIQAYATLKRASRVRGIGHVPGKSLDLRSLAPYPAKMCRDESALLPRARWMTLAKLLKCHFGSYFN